MLGMTNKNDTEESTLLFELYVQAIFVLSLMYSIGHFLPVSYTHLTLMKHRHIYFLIKFNERKR